MLFQAGFSSLGRIKTSFFCFKGTMTLQFTESDLNTLIRSFAKKNISLYLLGPNSFEVKVFRLFSADCKIDRFSERSVSISYDSNFLVNQLVKFLGKIEKKGMIWDKKNAKIHLDLIQLLQEGNPNLPLEIGLKSIQIDGKKLTLDFALSPLENFNLEI